jgi:hypothetical protein
MTKLEGMKLKAELLGVQKAKADMEYVVEQRLMEIERLRENILNQEKAEELLNQKLSGE